MFQVDDLGRPADNNRSNNEPCGPTVLNTMASTLVSEAAEAIISNTRATNSDTKHQVSDYFRGK